MPETAVTSDINEPADVPLDLSAQVTLDQRSAAVERAAKAVQLFLAEFTDTRVAGECRLLDYAPGHSWANAINGSQCDLDPLVVRYVHSSDECHVMFLKPKPTGQIAGRGELALALLVPSVAAQHAYHSLTTNHLAVGAASLYGCSNFHISEPAPDESGMVPVDQTSAGLLEPVSDPATCEVVRGEFHKYAVAPQHPDEIQPDFS